jgi:Na+-translocating ferredoxin:NAD+ oxidoreductase subunit G
MTHVHGATAAPVPDAGTPSAKLLATLGGAGALAGLLIVLVYRATTPAIEANRASVVQAAIAEVLQHPARWDTLYLDGGKLTKSPVGDRSKLERAYEGFDESGKAIGVAIQAGEPGFADVISVMFGMNETDGSLLAMKILAQKETPGLGDKVEKDSAFIQQFTGAKAPIAAVKGGRKPPSEIDAITGATISSRTVVKVINNAVARWTPLLAEYHGAGQAASNAGAKP